MNNPVNLFLLGILCCMISMGLISIVSYIILMKKRKKKIHIKSLKNMGFLMPTVFDLIDVWKSNSDRYGGLFNYIFFWTYPIAFIVLFPLTALCLIELFITELLSEEF